ncbi:MAG: sulfite exporter TauE/SafE family protein [Actinobacteria bacterium]|nr:sulfite exporter TauE/SafE family protein [Actinomycetota bacterium]
MRRAVVVLGLLLGVALPSVAFAHPLGNFTTNHYSRVVASGDRVYVLYVLDLAEIPTFQEKPTAAKLLPKIQRGISVQIDGRAIPLHSLRHALAFPPGVAGLRTTRLESVYATPRLLAGSRRLTYRDSTFPGRIGWKEIVVQQSDGATVSSSASSRSVSDELHAYPRDQLSSPLDVRSASAEVVPGTGPGVAPTLSKGTTLDSRVTVHQGGNGGFAGLISREKLSAGFVALALLLAFFWGAVHALSPGHGKSIVAAYLVGTRGTPRHAALLGLTVTVTHTIGVFALGLVTLALSAFIFPEQLYPWLNLASALLVVLVGCGVLRARLRHRRMHAHGHDHHHGHHHHHDDQELSMRALLGVGISGGLIPCPTALVVLLAAISLHRVGYGLVLILAFSLGLAAAMTAIGLLAVSAKKLAGRLRLEGRVVRALPALSAAVILVLGLVMTVRALPGVV